MGQRGLKIAGFGVHTVKEVDLEVPPGHCIGLSGPSGTGKTLLLRGMADLDPHQGRMWLDGVPAESMPVDQWRRQVGLLPAESAWWHDTVGPHFTDFDNTWLAQLGFTDEVMGWPVIRLSSGERQRLALLRLLVNYPKALLLDEPTANLDAQSAHRVEKLLSAYRRNHHPAIVWVSHDLAQLRRNCGAVYAIRDGRLVGPQESMAAPEPTGAPAGETL